MSDILSNRLKLGQKAVIDRGMIGGRHIKLSDGESFLYVESGSFCTIRSFLLNGWIVVSLDKGGWVCEVDSKNLSRLFERTPMQNIELFSYAGLNDEDL
jgi:hypothetical protein